MLPGTDSPAIELVPKESPVVVWGLRLQFDFESRRLVGRCVVVL